MNRIAEVTIIILLVAGCCIGTFFITKHLIFQDAYAKGHADGYKSGYDIGHDNGMADEKRAHSILKSVESNL